MQVILLKDVKGVGKRCGQKNVSDGYASNFLLPRNFALIADKAGIAKAEQLKEQSEAKRTREEEILNEKEAKRLEKHEALEKFRREHLSTKLEIKRL